MPSTPRFQEMPSGAIQRWSVTSWKPPSADWNSASTAAAMPSTPTEASAADRVR